MELRIFLLADFANLDASNKLNIIGAFSTIYVGQIPVTHPNMHLVAKVVAELGEFGKTRNFDVIFFDEDATELGKIQGTVAFPQPTSGHYSEWNLVLGLRDITFNKEGRYEFRLLVNDYVVGTVPLDIVLRPELPQE